MRILTLSNLYPNPHQPNRAPWNRQQLRAVAEQHEVRVISPISWTDEWQARRKQGNLLPRSRRVTLDGIEIEHPRYWFPPKVLRGWYGRCFLESIRASYARVVKEFRPEVLLASWAYPDGWAAARLAARDRLPLAIKVHGSDILTLKQYPARLRGTIAALRQADVVIAVSQHLSRELEALGVDPSRVQVVYNGIDTDRFFPGDRAEARRELGWDTATGAILFVGNLAPVKQVDVLLSACRQLSAAGLDFRYHIVGDGPLRQVLESMARDFGLSDKVVFHGVVNHDDLPTWFRAADVVCLPSRSEGVPNVLLEAKACGTPFVASRVGGIPEIADASVDRLVASGDAHKLAEAMATALSVPISRTTSDHGWWSWGQSAVQLVEILRSIRSSMEPHCDLCDVPAS